MTLVDAVRTPTIDPYPAEELELDLRWWAAANYLTVGQIYLQDDALLTRPLQHSDVKPRLLGHWGTSPGLSALYVQLNRLIRRTGTPCLYVAGPGDGGPALVANTWLEGTYSEVYPAHRYGRDGVHRLFRQFSTPGGIPSHVSVPTPGRVQASAPEFGELLGKRSALVVTGSSGGRTQRCIHRIGAEHVLGLAVRRDHFDSAAACA